MQTFMFANSNNNKMLKQRQLMRLKTTQQGVSARQLLAAPTTPATNNIHTHKRQIVPRATFATIKSNNSNSRISHITRVLIIFHLFYMQNNFFFFVK